MHEGKVILLARRHELFIPRLLNIVSHPVMAAGINDAFMDE